MGKRKAIPIDKLTTEHLGDFGKVIDEAESPLACALVVTALLENTVMTLLHAFFIEHKETESLFSFNGSLDGFSKCAQMAYCLGFIPEAVLKNLNRIGTIRNTFAHSTKVLDFETPEIVKLCGELTLPKVEEMMAGNMKMPEQIASHSPEEIREEWAAIGSRERFILIGTFLMAHIVAVAAKTGRRQTMNKPIIW